MKEKGGLSSSQEDYLKQIYVKTAYKFLTEFLGVSAAEAEEEAHLMEHAMSKATRKKLKKFMRKKK